MKYCDEKDCPFKRYCKRWTSIITGEAKSVPKEERFNRDKGVCESLWICYIHEKIRCRQITVYNIAEPGIEVAAGYIDVDNLRSILRGRQELLSYEERLDAIPLHVIQKYYEQHMNGKVEVKR